MEIDPILLFTIIQIVVCGGLILYFFPIYFHANGTRPFLRLPAVLSGTLFIGSVRALFWAEFTLYAIVTRIILELFIFHCLLVAARKHKYHVDGVS